MPKTDTAITPSVSAIGSLLEQQAKLREQMAQVNVDDLVMAVHDVLRRPHVRAAIEELKPLNEVIQKREDVDPQVKQAINLFVVMGETGPVAIQNMISRRANGAG